MSDYRTSHYDIDHEQRGKTLMVLDAFRMMAEGIDNDVINYALKALKINEKKLTYINEIFSNNETIYDLLSVAYYYTNNRKKSIYYINKAIKLDPKNSRLAINKQLILANKKEC